MNLIVPFLTDDPEFCRGVEFGMSVASPMLAGDEEVSGYFRTENEEQIRLAAHRLGYEVVELESWEQAGQETGWVWMKMAKK